MISWIANRALVGLLVIFLLASVIFIMFRILPTDPSVMLVDAGMTPETRRQLLAEFGLDRPLIEQYFIYIYNIATGNFGNSFYFRTSAIDVVIESTKNTLVILVPSIVIGATLGCTLGAYLGWMRRDSALERSLLLVLMLVRGAPGFVIGLLLLLFFSFWMGWFPGGGMRTPGMSADASGPFLNLDLLQYAVLPVATVALSYIPETALVMRTSIMEARGEDYLEFVKAKGASNARIMFHAARNSLLPVMTWIFISVGNLISGIVVVETVFSWPGIGRELVLSVSRLDYPVAQAAFFIIAAVVVFMNVATDLLYAFLDPRVAVEGDAA